MIMKRALAKKNGKKGFTLVEVIVVLVILAILAAIAIPALTGYIDKANKRAVVTEARTIGVSLQTIASEGYGDGYSITDPATAKTGATTLTALFTPTYVDVPDYLGADSIGKAVSTLTGDTSLASKLDAAHLSEITFSGNKLATFKYVGSAYTAVYSATTGKYAVTKNS
jgi:prepilin-type N-terminal cleavage/methylation domain-containing protein